MKTPTSRERFAALSVDGYGVATAASVAVSDDFIALEGSCVDTAEEHGVLLEPCGIGPVLHEGGLCVGSEPGGLEPELLSLDVKPWGICRFA